MKKHSKTTTVYRIPQEKGNYTTVSRNILMNPNLTDSAKTLLQLCLNNTEDWKLVLSFYRKKLRWSNDKLSYAVTNLIENGYLRKDKYSKGKGNGFYYTYIISEYGNLNPNKEKADADEVLACISEAEDEELIQQEESIENNLDEISVENVPQLEIPKEQPQQVLQPFEYDKEFAQDTLLIIASHVKTNDDEFFKNVVQHYAEQITCGKITPNNFNEEKIAKVISDRLVSVNKPIIEQYTRWIDLHNGRGTKDQRANLRLKALAYFQELLENKQEITENIVSTKMLRLSLSLTANRVVDSRYQD